MNTTLSSASAASWSLKDAEEIYRVPYWSDGYFGINDAGHVTAQPGGNASPIDLHTIVQDLHNEQVQFPVLIRFQDILHGRVKQLNEAFRKAIVEYGYGNHYTSIYPIKVNQLHEVVEEILEAGKPYGLGLECGSKAELVAALPHLTSDETLLICNGYKDAEMMRLILMGQKLGKAVIPVLEKRDEFERFMPMAKKARVQPRFGVRVQLATAGNGQWATSSGDGAKFGLPIPELVYVMEHLESAHLRDSLCLLHFHIGSQITDIQTLKQAIREITQVYAHLRKRGLNVQYIDVGGGLGVNYDATYRGFANGINYSLDEYANSVVYAIQEVCEAEAVPPPTILSESGRALTAHHSVLIVEALSAYQKPTISLDFTPSEGDHRVVRDLYEAWQQVLNAQPTYKGLGSLLEAYHDAIGKRTESQMLFSFGYFPLEQQALAERLYWTTLHAIDTRLAEMKVDSLPGELEALDEYLFDQYLCDFSVFQSLLDHWAIGQRFPIMPLARLNEVPTRRGVLVDLTCDSDGKVKQYLSVDGVKPYLPLHTLRKNEPYLLGFFMMGAYQDIMGDMHNLFGRVTEIHVYADAEEPHGYYIEKTIPGDTIEGILAQMQYFPNDLQRRMSAIIREKVEAGAIRPKAGVDLLKRYTDTFAAFTYLNPRS